MGKFVLRGFVLVHRLCLSGVCVCVLPVVKAVGLFFRHGLATPTLGLEVEQTFFYWFVSQVLLVESMGVVGGGGRLVVGTQFLIDSQESHWSSAHAI